MGYDMYAAPIDGHDGYFRANVWWMGLLRGALHGIDLLTDEEPPKHLTDEPFIEWASSGHGLPVHKISSNDGWLVSEAEAKSVADGIARASETTLTEIARTIVTAHFEYEAKFNKTPVRPVTEDDVEALVTYVRDFGAYCERASRTGGFRVY
jgi:hypothetical protein